MNKIPTLFVRDPETKHKHILNEVNEDCEWVLAGEGVATRKFDGTCCMIDEAGDYYKRQGSGWVLVTPDRNDDMWHRAADHTGLPAGTYELCGPKVQSNAEGFDVHTLVPHGKEELPDAPRTFDALREYLTDPAFTFEGIVWHHPDGRMAKLKKRDFPRSSTER